MPLYFFHVRNKQSLLDDTDDEGLLLGDEHAAWQQATRACGEMIHDMNGSLEAGHEWRMEVAGEDGKLLFAIRVFAEFYQ